MKRNLTTVAGLLVLGVCLFSGSPASAGYPCGIQSTVMSSIGALTVNPANGHVQDLTWPQSGHSVYYDVDKVNVTAQHPGYYNVSQFNLKNRIADGYLLVASRVSIIAWPWDKIGSSIGWHALYQIQGSGTSYFRPTNTYKNGNKLSANSHHGSPAGIGLSLNNQSPEYMLTYTNMGRNTNGESCNGRKLMGVHINYK